MLDRDVDFDLFGDSVQQQGECFHVGEYMEALADLDRGKHGKDEKVGDSGGGLFEGSEAP